MIDTVEIRCRILELAFAGKLSSHMNGDDSVEDMLLSNKIKSFNEEKGAPYDIPKHWKWVRLSELYDINPKVNANDSDDAAFVPMERISAGFNNTFTFETQSWKQASNNHTKFMNGDVCFAKISPCFENRKSFVADDLPNSIGGGTTELIVLRQQAMNPLYTYYIVNDRRFIHDGSASYKGIVGQQRVKSDIIKNFLVPVPPYKEQSRIVETIKRIFHEIDKIDQYQSQYASDIEVLKSKLIDAAIRGKLTEQLSEDCDAEDLYNQIQDEKAKFIKEGKIKKEKFLPDISEDEIPFEIPKSWKWVRIGKVINEVIVPQRDKPSFSGDIPWCRIEDRDGIYLNGTKSGQYVSEQTVKEMNLRIFPVGTVLSACSGASIGTILINTVECCTNQTFNGLVCNDLFYNWYLFWFLKSEIHRLKSMGSGSAMAYISQDKIRNMLIPLPPIAEQRRIVEKIDVLLNVFD